MTDTLLVVLEDAVAGELSRLRGGRLRFEYDEQYRARAGATPLSLSMPIRDSFHSDDVVAPWLSGLLPDNDAVLARWARHFHVSARSPFSLLSTPIGVDCAGAVRFVAPEGIDRVLARTGEVAWLTDEDVAERLRELREDSTAWLGESFTGQFSLAGAQAKTALLLEDGRWGAPTGATPTTHILKPAVAGLHDHDLNEHMCLDAARRAGLLAARSKVTSFMDETAVVVTRYDRSVLNGDILRVHQEDVCQALSVPPVRKYQNEGGPGVGDVNKLLREVMPPGVADEAASSFADALIWNWLIAGTDAHAKNYSLLLAGDQVRLAPLYDIASALPYGAHERKLRFAMKIGGDYRVCPQRNTWPFTAREMGLDREALPARVLELARVAPDAFSDASKSSDITTLKRDLPGRLVDLVADRIARCVRVLEGLGARA